MPDRDAPAAAAAPISLLTQDGYSIAARLYTCTGAVRARLIVAGATGVPQSFYQAFAEFAASHGYETLTLDYRGIGLSKTSTLKGYEMDYLDWAYQDLAAAIDYWHSDGYPAGIWQGVDIDPAALGLKGIGHMGYFRRQAQPLWRDALAWFEHSPTA